MRRSLGLLPVAAALAFAGCGGTYGDGDAAAPRGSSARTAGDAVVLHSIRPRGHRHHVAAPIDLAER
jgi:hypothetical protein